MIKIRLHTGLLAAAALLTLGVSSARADLIQDIPFSLIGSPTQETVYIPQFDPAQGTLNSLMLSVSGSVQFVLEVLNSGAGPVSVTAQDRLSFAGTPLLAENTFTSTIPTPNPLNPAPYVFSPAAVSLGVLMESFGPDVASSFTGTGALPFQLSLASPMVDQFSGSTVYNVLAFSGASGTITADYAFTPPSAATAPEPATLAMAGFGLIAAGLLARRKRDYLAQKVCSPLLYLAQS